MKHDVAAPEFTRAAVGVVALCFLLNTLARGCGETFAVFYGPLLAEFGWGRGATASLYSAFMIALGAAGPVIGAVFDRYGGRAVYVCGLAAYGAGFLLASRMTELWHGWIGLGLLVGFGAAATGMTPATGIISRWFDRNMGFAIAFAYSGFAFGSMLLAPLTGIMIERGGWRWTYAVLGSGLLVLGAVVLLLPWARIGRGVREAPVRPRSLLPDRRVLGRVPFWGLFLVFFMTSVATYAVQVQVVVYLEEAGYDRLTATLVFGANSLISVLGIVGAGWLSDRIGARLVATIAYGLSIAGILALLGLGRGPDPLLLAVFLLGFGGAMGSRGPVVSSLTARLFHGQVGAVFGLVMIGLGLGGAFGAWVAGWLHEATGDYRAGLGVAVLACLVGAGTFWAVPELARGRWRDA
jgi:MFS family permease